MTTTQRQGSNQLLPLPEQPISFTFATRRPTPTRSKTPSAVTCRIPNQHCSVRLFITKSNLDSILTTTFPSCAHHLSSRSGTLLSPLDLQTSNLSPPEPRLNHNHTLQIESFSSSNPAVAETPNPARQTATTTRNQQTEPAYNEGARPSSRNTTTLLQAKTHMDYLIVC